MSPVSDRGRFRAGLAALLLVAGCSQAASTTGKAAPADGAAAGTQKAIFAGGCFWCSESDFEKLPGVISAVSGYTGGHTKNVKYEDTHDGSTGHTEAVEVVFDPKTVTYAQLVDHFFMNHDPFNGDGQFCDGGNQYRPGIFYLDEAQKAAAITVRDTIQKRFDVPFRTEITQAGVFWLAEDYHQDYYKKNPLRYKLYRSRCGRDDRIGQIWQAAKPVPAP